jgi:hypothetical protein
MSRLKQQQELVERKVFEAERARLAFVFARTRFVGRVKRRLASPRVLLIAFGWGFAWGAGRPIQRGAAATKAASKLPRKLIAAGATWLAQRQALRRTRENAVIRS